MVTVLTTHKETLVIMRGEECVINLTVVIISQYKQIHIKSSHSISLKKPCCKSLILYNFCQPYHDKEGKRQRKSKI